MIDMHCHIDLYPNPHHIVKQCVGRRLDVLSVTTVPSAFEGTVALAPVGGRIRTALGLHPELAVARERELPLFEQLLPQTPYVGEIGLDGSRSHRETLDRQAAILTEILHMCAHAGGRIISMHSRGAVDLLLRRLTAQSAAGTFILHWFLGSTPQIKRATEIGCWFSVNPAMLTTKNGITAVAEMPIYRVLPESDGPFVLLKGTSAYPWDAWEIVPNLAKLWRKNTQDVEKQLLANFNSLITLQKK